MPGSVTKTSEGPEVGAMPELKTAGKMTMPASSATNVRLQEATIGYTIPKKKLGDIVEINISLVGRNLWMIYNKAPFVPEGIDYFMMPSLRSVGFNLRLKF